MKYLFVKRVQILLKSISINELRKHHFSEVSVIFSEVSVNKSEVSINKPEVSVNHKLEFINKIKILICVLEIRYRVSTILYMHCHLLVAMAAQKNK